MKDPIDIRKVPVSTDRVRSSWQADALEYEVWYKPVPVLWRWGFYRMKRRVKVKILPDVPYVRTLEDALLREHE